jgi:hypothetical protein
MVTRFGLGGPGAAYAGFTAKEAGEPAVETHSCAPVALVLKVI